MKFTLITLCLAAAAANTIETTGTGFWYNTGTWSLSRYPRSGDTVEITSSVSFNEGNEPALYSQTTQGKVINLDHSELEIASGTFEVGMADNAPQNCGVPAFPVFSACSKSCGTGSQSRSRTLTAPRYGGDVCPHSAETQSCTDGPCPIHCETSVFSAWTACTKSCGTGQQSRSRSVLTAPLHGGDVCPFLEETRACNDFACAADCIIGDFGAWSSCSKSCGGGSQSRSRSNTDPSAGGTACPHEEETRACNSFACAASCQVGTWSAWTSCTKACDTGVQSRSRTNVAPTAGGTACPHSAETQHCNDHACTCSTTSGLKSHGEHFMGAGAEFCNRCRCHNGQAVCTDRDCGVANKQECAKTTCTYGLRFTSNMDEVVPVATAIAQYGAGLASAPAHTLATLVKHSATDPNGDKFRCGVTDYTLRMTPASDCKCYCSNSGASHIWHHAVRHATEVAEGRTQAGCECMDNWTYNGQTYQGCQNPKVDGAAVGPNGFVDTHGHAPYPWCMTKTGTCVSSRVPAGTSWDSCEPDAHHKITVQP